MSANATTAAPTGRKKLAQGKEQGGKVAAASRRSSAQDQSRDGSATLFSQRGGLGKAHQLFGEQLPKLLDELNTVLAA